MGLSYCLGKYQLGWLARKICSDVLYLVIGVGSRELQRDVGGAPMAEILTPGRCGPGLCLQVGSGGGAREENCDGLGKSMRARSTNLLHLPPESFGLPLECLGLWRQLFPLLRKAPACWTSPPPSYSSRLLLPKPNPTLTLTLTSPPLCSNQISSLGHAEVMSYLLSIPRPHLFCLLQPGSCLTSSLISILASSDPGHTSHMQPPLIHSPLPHSLLKKSPNRPIQSSRIISPRKNLDHQSHLPSSVVCHERPRDSRWGQLLDTCVCMWGGMFSSPSPSLSSQIFTSVPVQSTFTPSQSPPESQLWCLSIRSSPSPPSGSGFQNVRPGAERGCVSAVPACPLSEGAHCPPITRPGQLRPPQTGRLGGAGPALGRQRSRGRALASRPRGPAPCPEATPTSHAHAPADTPPPRQPRPTLVAPPLGACLRL